MPFGEPGDLPVTGDWDGNLTTEVGVWSPDYRDLLRASRRLGDGRPLPHHQHRLRHPPLTSIARTAASTGFWHAPSRFRGWQLRSLCHRA